MLYCFHFSFWSLASTPSDPICLLSPYIIADTPEQKVCSEFGCLQILGKNEVIFQPRTFAIKATLREIENLYILKEKIQHLKGAMRVEGFASGPIKILPDYTRYINYDELDRKVSVFIEAPIECFAGESKYTRRYRIIMRTKSVKWN